jgi:hypothetical protein
MKILKLTLWTVLFFILQTVFADLLRIYGHIPDLLMVFAMIYSFYETDKTYLLFTVLACGILGGSGLGREFSLVVLFTALGSAVSCLAGERLRFIAAPVRLFAVMIFFVAALGFSEFFIVKQTFSFTALLNDVLPHTAYTLITGIIMYPIMMRTILYKPKKKFIVA